MGQWTFIAGLADKYKDQLHIIYGNDWEWNEGVAEKIYPRLKKGGFRDEGPNFTAVKIARHAEVDIRKLMRERIERNKKEKGVIIGAHILFDPTGKKVFEGPVTRKELEEKIAALVKKATPVRKKPTDIDLRVKSAETTMIKNPDLALKRLDALAKKLKGSAAKKIRDRIRKLKGSDDYKAAKALKPIRDDLLKIPACATCTRLKCGFVATSCKECRESAAKELGTIRTRLEAQLKKYGKGPVADFARLLLKPIKE